MYEVITRCSRSQRNGYWDCPHGENAKTMVEEFGNMHKQGAEADQSSVGQAGLDSRD
jgi:hypothetical protein